MKDPLQIKIIEQADEEDSSDEDDDSEPEEDSPKGTPKGTHSGIPFIASPCSSDGKANDVAKSEAWDIPGPKNKERLPLPELPISDVARSAPELQRLAPEDDDGHIEYKVRCNRCAVLAAHRCRPQAHAGSAEAREHLRRAFRAFALADAVASV